MASIREKNLQYFDNPNVERDYLIEIKIPEFTCLCPLTGQPDFAFLKLKYVPNDLCVELKSLKLYIWSYRDRKGFHEALTNNILDDIVALISPRFAKLRAEFNVRGGTYPVITCVHQSDSWNACDHKSVLDLS